MLEHCFLLFMGTSTILIFHFFKCGFTFSAYDVGQLGRRARLRTMSLLKYTTKTKLKVCEHAIFYADW